MEPINKLIKPGYTPGWLKALGYEWNTDVGEHPDHRWTIERIKEYTRQCIDYYYWVAPSQVVLKANYVDYGSRWRFEKMRAIVEQEIKIYKQQINDK